MHSYQDIHMISLHDLFYNTAHILLQWTNDKMELGPKQFPLINLGFLDEIQ